MNDADVRNDIIILLCIRDDDVVVVVVVAKRISVHPPQCIIRACPKRNPSWSFTNNNVFPVRLILTIIRDIINYDLLLLLIFYF